MKPIENTGIKIGDFLRKREWSNGPYERFYKVDKINNDGCLTFEGFPNAIYHINDNDWVIKDE